MARFFVLRLVQNLVRNADNSHAIEFAATASNARLAKRLSRKSSIVAVERSFHAISLLT